MKEILIKTLEVFGLAWWVEVVTEAPSCTYYFGPFLSKAEAEAESSGYIEDLKLEGATGISVKIDRLQPSELTVFDELGEPSDRERFSALSGQWS